MATKAEIRFKVYEGGKQIRSVYAVTTQNSKSELKDKLFTEIKKEYPQLEKSDVVFNRDETNRGFWYIEATHDTLDFVLLISIL